MRVAVAGATWLIGRAVHGERLEALADNFVQTTDPATPRSATTSMEEAMNSAPAVGESYE